MEIITELPKLQKRHIDGHKGTFGKVLVVGGSVGFSGAPALAGMAALRSGAGLVRVAVPAPVLSVVAGHNPCYTTLPLPENPDGQMASEAASALTPLLADYDTVAFGPGAGTGAGVRDTLMSLLAVEGLRLVVDADGLNVLSQ